MSFGEFDLIAKYFSWPAPAGMLGVGDDCALIEVQPGCQLAVSTDTLIEGRHFFSDVDPVDLGHKALAVNLSDLAAMGAKPLAFTLALSLPVVDHPWLAAFAEGLRALAQACGCPLLGGDTTRSSAGVIISISVMGEVPRAQALLRSGARPGHDVWVSGALGAPLVALQIMQNKISAPAAVLRQSQARLLRPEPRLALGQALRGIASAAIDISDGLLQDLAHLLRASGCQARLEPQAILAHPALAAIPEPLRSQAILAGGDEYELCFSAARGQRATIAALAARLQLPLSRIGHLRAAEPGAALIAAADGTALNIPGYDHFAV